MAVIKLAAPLAGIRGTLSGVTYSANGAGIYAKSWARPPRSKTTPQSFERMIWSAAPTVWRDTLTAANRAAWTVYAADVAQALTNSLGDTYYANAYNWFLRISIHLIRAGRALSVTPPAGATPATPTVATWTAETGDVADSGITYTAAEWSGYDMVCTVSQSRSGGMLQAYSGFLELTVTQSPGNAAENLQTEMDALYGAVALGQRYHLRAYRQSTEGRRSAPYSISATCTQ